MTDIPVFSVDLIEQLENSYPERIPNLDMSEKEIWFYAGQRTLVRNLASKLKQQLEEKEGTI